MILYVNHTRRDAAAATANEVVATVLSLLEEGHLEPAQYARLRIDLDWMQYKQNFREPVMVTRPNRTKCQARPKSRSWNLHIDSRQISAGSLRQILQCAFASLNPEIHDASPKESTSKNSNLSVPASPGISTASTGIA